MPLAHAKLNASFRFTQALMFYTRCPRQRLMMLRCAP